MQDDFTSLILRRVRALTAYRLDPHPASVKLDQNENTLGPPEPILAEMEERLRSIPLFRYPTPGQPEIRAALSKAFDWPAEGILVGNGSDELLNTIALAVLEPGRVALAPTPSFFVYGQAARIQGADVVEVPLTENFEYDVDAFVDAVSKHAPHLVFLCSPNNPTGTVLSVEGIRRIVTSAPGLVVLDEAYWEFCGENGRALLDELDNLLIFRTFSKAFGMAGLRVGYVLLQPSLRRQIVKVQQPYPLNRVSQEAVLAALSHYDLVLARAAEIAATREALGTRLGELPGVEVFPSRTNFLLFRTSLSGDDTFQGLLERGVLVRNVSAHPRLQNLLRATIGTEEENESFYAALRETVEAGA
ncbi:MAG: histidinol-phosphate transaminase [Acidobacteria bacterium]|nr:MAG: histidinol-phosphate transaminase [Acidobacteriota bacterium]